MSTRRVTRIQWVAGLMALFLCVGGPRLLGDQGPVPGKHQAKDAAAFKAFTARVAAYVTLQKQVASALPNLKTTDLPEMITAHQQALARTIREARPRAKAGDVFTSAARDAFRRASLVALGGPGSATLRAYMQPGAPSPAMPLNVNGIYPEAEPITALPPGLLAAYPQLPAELAYRTVGRRLILVDVESRLVVDVARLILPPL